MKKLISLIITFALLVSICQIAVAENDNNTDVCIQNHIIETEISERELATYEKYQITFDDLPPDKKVVKDWLTETSTVINKVTINGYQITTYSNDRLKDYLQSCKTISDISMLGENIYIIYQTTDGKSVTLCYNDTGLTSMGVADPINDVAIVIENGKGIKYTNYIEATSITVSENLINEIEELVLAEEWETLSLIDEIEVLFLDNGGIIIEPVLNTTRGVDAITNNAQLLADLQADFPPYTKQVKGTYSMYCSALGHNISVQVKESRNAYTKQSANFASFAVNTSLTTIVSIMSWSSMTVAVGVLTLAGIAISAIDTILSACSLAKTAKYRYTGMRAGYAFDTTVYNTYVRVIAYSGAGEFTGGNNSNGVFTWIHSSYSSAFNHSYTEIANTTINNYNAHITINGVCISYYPD